MKITNLATCTSTYDAANKYYVDQKYSLDISKTFGYYTMDPTQFVSDSSNQRLAYISEYDGTG